MTHRVGRDNITGPPEGVIFNDLTPPFNWGQRFMGFLGALFAAALMVFTMYGWVLVWKQIF